VLKPTYVEKKGELIIRKEALLKSSQKSLYEEKAKKLNKPGGNDWDFETYYSIIVVPCKKSAWN
jgi:hypothetical protein